MLMMSKLFTATRERTYQRAKQLERAMNTSRQTDAKRDYLFIIFYFSFFFHREVRSIARCAFAKAVVFLSLVFNELNIEG